MNVDEYPLATRFRLTIVAGMSQSGHVSISHRVVPVVNGFARLSSRRCERGLSMAGSKMTRHIARTQ